MNITQQHPNNTHRSGNTESMLVKAMRNEFPELEAVIQVIGPNNALMAIELGTSKERIFEEKRNVFFVDSLFLKNFDYKFIAGNPRSALDDPNSIVLSSKLAEKFYPSFQGRKMDLLGKEIVLFDSLRTTITGIIDSPPSNSNFAFQALVSSGIYYKSNPWDRDNWGNIAAGMTFCVLAPNQKLEEIKKGFPALVTKYRSEDDAKMVTYSLLNLKELHTTSTWGPFSGNYTTSAPIEIGFKVIGLFILISACINFINLQTAQSINRAKEVGIRKVLGGSRLQLIFQFLIETAILTTISFLFALWIVEILLDSWNGLLSIVHMNMQLDFSVIIFGVILILIVTLIAGLYPALKLSSFQPTEALRSKFSLKTNKNGALSLRQILVLTQFVISQVLVIGTIVIAYQMDYFISKDLGFAKEGILHIDSYQPNRQQIDRLVQGLEAIPEISSYSLSSGPPMPGYYGTSFREVGHEDKGDIKTENKFIDHRFIDHFEIKLQAGRNFRPDEFGDTIKGFIVNEALVKQLDVANVQEAVGKPLLCYGTQAPIVGVVKDFHSEGFSEEIGPVIMFPLDSHVNGVDVKVVSSKIAGTLTKLRNLWKEVSPNRTFTYMSIDDYLLRSYIVEGIMFKSIRLFSVIAILIGCLGLYGLVSFMAIQKTKEIGIRKVLGATYGQILAIFSRRFFILIIIAFVLAAPLAYKAMELWLSNYVYRITLSWPIFALGFLITLVLTTITVGYISFKTARTNPAETLQFE